MVVVALDTSTRRVTVAVARSRTSVAELTLDAAALGVPRHAEILTPALDFLCHQLGVRLRDASAVAVGVGPGTFTGLRVGVVAAKTLAMALALPVVAVSSLELLARSQRGATGATVVPVFDARRHEVYWAAFTRSGDDLVRRAPDAIATPAALRDALAALTDDGGAVRLCGDGAHRFAEGLAGIAGVEAARVEDAPSSAAVLASMAFDHLELGTTVAAESVAPVYLRASDAELAADRASA